MIDNFNHLISMLKQIPYVYDIKSLFNACGSLGTIFFTKEDSAFESCYSLLFEISNYIKSEHNVLAEYFSLCIKEAHYIDNVQYSNSKPSLERGYYCQLPYIKKKGSLLKRKVSFKKANFKYYIKEGKLYCIEKRDSGRVFSREFLIYDKNCTMGISNVGDTNTDIFTFRYDEYINDKIIRHIQVLYDGCFQIEDYEYRYDDVIVSQIYIDVNRRMGKRYMLSYYTFNGNSYTV